MIGRGLQWAGYEGVAPEKGAPGASVLLEGVAEKGGGREVDKGSGQ